MSVEVYQGVYFENITHTYIEKLHEKSISLLGLIQGTFTMLRKAGREKCNGHIVSVLKNYMKAAQCRNLMSNDEYRFWILLKYQKKSVNLLSMHQILDLPVFSSKNVQKVMTVDSS